MRGFSEQERERIEAGLMDAGRELFARYGLGKTTIADLTDEVGIGTSTFYRFYDSKETLYLAVLEREGEAIAERLAAAGIHEQGDPQAVVEGVLHFVFEEIETNELAQRLIVENELDRLRAVQNEADREAERREEVAAMRAFIDPFVESGAIHGDDADLVARAINAIPLLTIHESDIGERYPEVRDFVIETFARGLVADGAPRS